MTQFNPFAPPTHWLPAATTVVCPVCHADAGAICRSQHYGRSKALWGRPHLARTKVARAVALTNAV